MHHSRPWPPDMNSEMSRNHLVHESRKILYLFRVPPFNISKQDRLNTAEKQRQITFSPAEEEEIIHKAQSDPAAFKPLYEAYFKRIFLFIVHRVNDKDIASDLSQ